MYQVYAIYCGMTHPVVVMDGKLRLGAMGRSPDLITLAQKDEAKKKFQGITVFDVDRDLDGIPVTD